MIVNLKNVTVFTLKVHYILNEASSWNFDHTFEISAYFAIETPNTKFQLEMVTVLEHILILIQL